MATANINSITPYLKEVYRDKIVDQLNQEVVALKRVVRSSDNITSDIGGKYVTFPIHTRRNPGIGSRFESEPLPVPGAQGYAAVRVGLKLAYASIEVTGPAIALSETNKQAFTKVITDEVSRVKDDIAKDMNRQVYQDGKGTIAVSTGANTAAVAPVKDARLFNKGDIVDTFTGTTRDNIALIVSSVSLAAGANTVTFTTTPGTALANGDIIVRTGSGPDATLGNRELTGLSAIIGNGDLFNVAVASEPLWQSVLDANGGTNRALSEGLMTLMVDNIRTNGGKTSLILQSLGVRRSYAALLMQTRSSVNTQEFTGGFKGLAFTTDGENGEIPVVADPDAPLNKQWFVSEKNLTFYRDKDWDWLDRNGSMWNRKTDANGVYDAYYANIGEYHELATDRRNTHGLISDITES